MISALVSAVCVLRTGAMLFIDDGDAVCEEGFSDGLAAEEGVALRGATEPPNGAVAFAGVNCSPVGFDGAAFSVGGTRDGLCFVIRDGESSDGALMDSDPDFRSLDSASDKLENNNTIPVHIAQHANDPDSSLCSFITASLIPYD